MRPLPARTFPPARRSGGRRAIPAQPLNCEAHRATATRAEYWTLRRGRRFNSHTEIDCREFILSTRSLFAPWMRLSRIDSTMLEMKEGV